MKLLLETLKSGADYLAKRGVEDPRLNMEHLLAHVLGCRRLDLYLRFETSLDESQLQPLRELTRRRGDGEPLQHLLGTVPFYGSEFVCDHRALIPRPETEYLVSLLIEKHFAGKPPGSVLDMGCGTGCIGLSLAKAWPGTQVTLADISEDALELARLNGERLGLTQQGVRFVRSDLFEKLAGNRFDLIVSNPPYIPTAEIRELSREVRSDPHQALDGGASGLDITFRLLADAQHYLEQDGWVAFELHHDQAPAVSERLQTLGFTDIQTAADLGRIERFVFGRYPLPPPSLPPAEPQEPLTEI